MIVTLVMLALYPETTLQKWNLSAGPLIAHIASTKVAANPAIPAKTRALGFGIVVFLWHWPL
jgi:hypothetical protein